MPDIDLRWRQRFDNVQRALQVLEPQGIQGITGCRDATRLAYQTELIAEVVIDRCVAAFAALRERFAALSAAAPSAFPPPPPTSPEPICRQRRSRPAIL